MTRQTLLRLAIISLVLAVGAALAFESVFDVTVRKRSPDPIVVRANRPAVRPSATTDPLPLRMVDSGGVGIPVGGTWGADYSHDRRTFRDVIRADAPYVDAAAFDRVAAEWRSYVERMIEYGNNAIAVPLLLEMIDFDRVAHPGMPAIYSADSTFRARHAALRRNFASLFEWADRRGMQVFLDSDMLALTAPLAEYLRALAPAAGAVGIDAANPKVWEVYRAGLDELFERMPSVRGLVIRFGEGGSLYNTEGWPYQSEVAVRSAADLRAMLRGLLPAFEAKGRTLVLRSWTVGVGKLGRLHIDPGVYEAVLGDIDSPALVVSTKYTAGDFFSYLPLNPALAASRHRRLVELQAKPEFEGFGAFPDFLGEEHARALSVLYSTNPRIVGAYVLTQFGGPLRAGPRTLYPLHGFWLWTDANVAVASGLAANPGADVRALTRRWVEATFGQDPQVVDAVMDVMTETRNAVLHGFYIRPFAEREVRVPGLDLPPLMWIFEWDIVAGWHSLLSIVHYAMRDDVDVAIAEGYAAASAVRGARDQLRAALAAATPVGSAPICDRALRSLEYQETLFDALAAWRHAFLSYYRWLDTGDANAWRAWRDGRERFEVAAARHTTRFGADPEFPAFDLTSAKRAVRAAERGGITRLTAALLPIAALALLVGTPSLRPGRRRYDRPSVGAAVAIMVVVLVLVGFVAGALTAFASPWLALGAAFAVGVIALTFTIAATAGVGPRWRAQFLVASTAPLLPGAAIVCCLIAWLGSAGLWYSFWTAPISRMVLVTIVVASILWTMGIMFFVRAAHGWRGGVSAALSTAGVTIVTLAALLPDGSGVLRYLDRPLNLAPATDTMLFALRTYAGMTLDAGVSAWIVGLILLVGGQVLRIARSSRTQSSQTPAIELRT